MITAATDASQPLLMSPEEASRFFCLLVEAKYEKKSLLIPEMGICRDGTA